jgi:predicted nucleic acid-binding protein
VTLVLDTGPIVAALNKGDKDHRRCAALLAGADDLLIPSPILVEVDYWLIKLGRATARTSRCCRTERSTERQRPARSILGASRPCRTNRLGLGQPRLRGCRLQT